MIGFIIKKIIGSKNDREVRKLRPMVAQINEIEAALQPKPEEYLREKTEEWKTRCAAIQDKDELRAVLDEILPEMQSCLFGRDAQFLSRRWRMARR